MVFVLSRDFVTVADRKYIKDAIIIPLILLLDTFYFSVSNLRKLLPVALSLLILLSLVPYARAQNNLTGSQMNMTGSQMNMTGSQMNMTGSQMNMTGSQMNMTGSQMNMTGSQMNMTGSQMNMTGSQMNMTGSQMNMTGSQNECWVVYFWHLSFSISNLMVLNLLEES